MVMKILCLHGHRQNGLMFREKSGAFRKPLKTKCDFVFIDANNKIDEESNSLEFAWWYSREDNYFHAHDTSDCIKGFNESLGLIKKTFKEQGPFDGIMGFSQGAGFLQILLHMREFDPELASIIDIKFAILVASFYSRSSQFKDLYRCVIRVPCLVIYGNDDRVIPRDMTEETLVAYTEKTVINHDGGHHMPMNAAIKQNLLSFVARFDK